MLKRVLLLLLLLCRLPHRACPSPLIGLCTSADANCKAHAAHIRIEASYARAHDGAGSCFIVHNQAASVSGRTQSRISSRCACSVHAESRPDLTDPDRCKAATPVVRVLNH
eukprot:TRINITY_DN3383_c0_g3_i1.p2 TRINITY_DN3383_c0_g3~~TRINITY_DN3383_c0_g3_i1.p2  ORF type:complete len:111 (+),score=0.97 TRINITY_DN3383_c0_g3_i1:2-334(+)